MVVKQHVPEALPKLRQWSIQLFVDLNVFDPLDSVGGFSRQNKLVQCYRFITETTHHQFVIQVPLRPRNRCLLAARSQRHHAIGKGDQGNDRQLQILFNMAQPHTQRSKLR